MEFTGWRCISGDQKTTSCCSDAMRYSVLLVIWCNLEGTSILSYDKKTKDFHTCCDGEGSTQTIEKFPENVEKVLRIDAKIKSQKLKILEDKMNLTTSEIEHWGCQSSSNGVYLPNNTKTLECAKEQIRPSFIVGGKEHKLNCSTYKNLASCRFRVSSDVYNEFEECCGGNNSMHM